MLPSRHHVKMETKTCLNSKLESCKMSDTSTYHHVYISTTQDKTPLLSSFETRNTTSTSSLNSVQKWMDVRSRTSPPVKHFLIFHLSVAKNTHNLRTLSLSFTNPWLILLLPLTGGTASPTVTKALTPQYSTWSLYILSHLTIQSNHASKNHNHNPHSLRCCVEESFSDSSMGNS